MPNYRRQREKERELAGKEEERGKEKFTFLSLLGAIPLLKVMLAVGRPVR